MPSAISASARLALGFVLQNSINARFRDGHLAQDASSLPVSGSVSHARNSFFIEGFIDGMSANSPRQDLESCDMIGMIRSRSWTQLDAVS
jgi:hypothetical protein